MALSASLPSTHEDAASLWWNKHLIFVPRTGVANLNRRPHRRLYYLFQRRALSDPASSPYKRIFDVVCASAALLLFAPVIAVIAAAIKLNSSGPVFFTQYRYGFRNRRFRIYKFRTMHTHMSDISGVVQTRESDPRITYVGAILRRMSLDELPQLINVLKGDMSLVGPRPQVPGMRAANMLYEDLVPYYSQRHAIRPGMTGLAQVNGCRGSTTSADAAISRVDYDLEYIERWSLWLDIKIICNTIRQEFLFGHGS